MAFKFLLCDSSGQVVTPIKRGRGRKVIVNRNGHRESGFTLSHEDADALAFFTTLRNGTPQLRVYEDDFLWFSGYLAGTNESLQFAKPSSDLVLNFLCPFGRMLHDFGRFVAMRDAAPGDDGMWTYTQNDQGDIAWDLIAGANNVEDTGIELGTIIATVLRDRSYDGDKNVAEAIVDLSQVIGGFDFDIAPLDPTASGGKLARFDVFARQGSGLDDVVFGAGPGTIANVDSVQRQITPPANHIRAVGGGSGVGEQIESVQLDQDSIDKYGVWERSFTETDVTEQTTLDAKALAALRPEWTKTVSFDANPILAPRPGSDYWIGDRAQFYARAGSFSEQMYATVNQITLSLDDEDSESFNVEMEQEAVI